MKKYWLYITGIIEMGFFTALLINFSLINYGFNQLKGQLNIIWNTQSIEKVLSDPNFPDTLKTKLILIQEIKAFAFDSIGINPSKNYTSVYDQKGKDILWVLTACEPYELKPYAWEFPVLGKVEYKGFFDLGKGKLEEEKIQKLGLDGGLGRVGAWSTLGFFKDPVLSNMLAYEEGDLADLIIHELTHGTLFVKGDVEFNENLASFIGNQGAKRFLAQRYGPDSPELQKYLEGKGDDEVYQDYVISSAKRLDSLYKVIKDEPVAVKELRKKEIFDDIILGVDALPLTHKDRYRKSIQKIHSHKNAYFMSFIRYGAKQDVFEKQLREEFNGDLKAYLAHLKKIYPSV
jgi:predicted aminopeptidase